MLLIVLLVVPGGDRAVDCVPGVVSSRVQQVVLPQFGKGQASRRLPGPGVPGSIMSLSHASRAGRLMCPEWCTKVVSNNRDETAWALYGWAGAQAPQPAAALPGPQRPTEIVSSYRG